MHDRKVWKSFWDTTCIKQVSKAIVIYPPPQKTNKQTNKQNKNTKQNKNKNKSNQILLKSDNALSTFAITRVLYPGSLNFEL